MMVIASSFFGEVYLNWKGASDPDGPDVKVIEWPEN